MRFSTPFLRFAGVGILGFLVDYTGYQLAVLWVSFVPARLIAFVLAVATTWLCNRAWTFKADRRHRRWWQEFGLYFLSMSAGGACNLSSSLFALALLRTVPFGSLFSLAIGSAVGLAVNYLLARKVVFKKRFEES
ncbi:GtrA family protein [Neisseriaceae bacterium TC5R-5]|nr:GtrA family protein [Neisseriaceae bacterium TC5R-5]